MTETTQPQTWRLESRPSNAEKGVKRLFIWEGETLLRLLYLPEQIVDAIIADHAAATKLAALEDRLETAAEDRAEIKASLLEYIDAFKLEAADNIALKTKLADAERERDALAAALEDVTDELEEFENQYRPVHEVGWERRLHEAGRESIQKARRILTTHRERSKA